MKTISTRDTLTGSALIARHEPFKTHGAMHAVRDEYPGGPGYLPSEWALLFETHKRDARSQGCETYVVYSYATPIAWWTEGYGWVVPPVKYSQTTTRHQSHLYDVRKGATTEVAA